MAIIFTLTTLYLKNALKSIKQCIAGLLLFAAAAYYGYLIAPAAAASPYLLSVVIPIGLFCLTIFISFFPALSLFHKPVQRYYPLSSFTRYSINLIADSFLNSYFVAMLIFTGMLLLNHSTSLFNYQNMLSALLFIFMAFVLRRAMLCIIYQQADAPLKKTSALITLFAMLLVSVISGKHITEPWWVITGMMVLLAGGFLIEEKLTQLQRKTITRYNLFDNTLLQIQFNNSKFLLHYIMLIVVVAVFLSAFSYVLHKKNITGTLQYAYIVCLFTSPLAVFTYILNNSFGFFDTYWLCSEKMTSSGKMLFMHYLRMAAIPLVTEVILMILFLIINPGQTGMTVLLHLGTLPLLLVLGFYWSVLFPRKIPASLLVLNTPTGVLPSILSITICLSFVTVQFSKWFALLGGVYSGIAVLLFVNINHFYKRKKYLLYQALFKQ